jgi:hypothetical protein
MMATAIETHAHPPRVIMLCPSSRSFFKNARKARAKARKEEEQGILVKYPDQPVTLPMRVYQEGYTQDRSGKDRRIGMGNSPGFGGEGFLLEGVDISLNAWIDQTNPTNFPQYQMPTVAQHAENIAITGTLYKSTQDKRHAVEQLYSDWEAYYRSLVPAAIYLWMTCIMIGGLYMDMGLYFGSSSAPPIAQRIMSTIVFWLQMIMVILLDKVTTWDVVNRCAVQPGNTHMFEHSQYGVDEVRERDELVDGISVHTAMGWDTDPRCRQWRQARYDRAKRLGLSQREAIANTLCCNFSGFIDDGQLSTIACMMPIVMAALFRVVALVGVSLSVAKLQWARNDRLWVVDTASNSQPTHPGELKWREHDSERFATCLGRLMDTQDQRIRDTPQRIHEVDQMTKQLVERGTASRTVMHHALRTYLGIVMYMIQINSQLRSLTSILWKLLTVKTRLGSQCQGRAKWHQPDYPVPWNKHATEHALILIDGLKMQRGRAFAHEQVAPTGVERPVVVILNDAAGDAKDEGVSFRGGASWLYTPGQTETPWAQYRWHYETQCQGRHSTLLELVNGNMSLEVVVDDYSGYDVVEVYDNQAVVSLCRSLATSKESLMSCLEHRRLILQKLKGGARVFTAWTAREHLTLSDELSKADWDAFEAGLAMRGLPKPACDPFLRYAPRM